MFSTGLFFVFKELEGKEHWEEKKGRLGVKKRRNRHRTDVSDVDLSRMKHQPAAKSREERKEGEEERPQIRKR